MNRSHLLWSFPALPSSRLIIVLGKCYINSIHSAANDVTSNTNCANGGSRRRLSHNIGSYAYPCGDEGNCRATSQYVNGGAQHEWVTQRSRFIGSYTGTVVNGSGDYHSE